MDENEGFFVKNRDLFLSDFEEGPSKPQGFLYSNDHIVLSFMMETADDKISSKYSGDPNNINLEGKVHSNGQISLINPEKYEFQGYMYPNGQFHLIDNRNIRFQGYVISKGKFGEIYMILDKEH